MVGKPNTHLGWGSFNDFLALRMASHLVSGKFRPISTFFKPYCINPTIVIDRAHFAAETDGLKFALQI